MENIFLPSKIEYTPDKETPTQKADLVIEPLFHGYGTTLGNALRRVLLSSLPRAAVTSLKIKGATHEFTTIKGIQEDILEIVLNLKQLRLKSHSDEPIKIKIEKKGKGAVTGKDVVESANVEVINKDLQIATVTDASTEFSAEITVEKGLGFLPTEQQDKSNLEVGAIAIDALFTPITKIGYSVEDTRVGQITNYDKLTLHVETDGSMTPQEAVESASHILMNHIGLLAGKAPVEDAIDEEKPAAKKKATAKKK